MSAHDRERFSQLYHQYGRLVRNFLFRLGARSQLDDLTQETFLKTWKNLDRLNEPRAAKAWILKIALHQFYDWGRAQKGAFIEFEEETVADESVPFSSRFETRMDAQQALDSLSLPLKSACVLFYLEDLSIPEVAELLQIPEGTVKTRLMKAREKMHAVLVSPETNARKTENKP